MKNDTGSQYHVPVMLNEAIEGLQIIPAGIYVDCTFGGGGHSKAILEQLNGQGRLIAFDQDADAKSNLLTDARVTFIPQNFRHLQRFLRLNKIDKVNGILADLGVSSHHFDEPKRGFSTRFNAPLDMRMDQRQEMKASFILKNYSEEKLHKLFETYGEITNAKTLAKTIIEQRMNISIDTVNKLKNAIQHIVKGNPNKYFAQVFQALRIEVNDELGALNELLQQLPGVLLKDGRISILTFHSVEDRMVKQFIRAGQAEDATDDNMYGNKNEQLFELITRKPLTASREEVEQNPRARSAKLRIAKRK